MLLGLAFISRYQVGIIIFSLFLWLFFFNKLKIKELFILLFGIFVIILFEIFLNTWGYQGAYFPSSNAKVSNFFPYVNLIFSSQYILKAQYGNLMNFLLTLSYRLKLIIFFALF